MVRTATILPLLLNRQNIKTLVGSTTGRKVFLVLLLLTPTFLKATFITNIKAKCVWCRMQCCNQVGQICAPERYTDRATESHFFRTVYGIILNNREYDCL